MPGGKATSRKLKELLSELGSPREAKAPSVKQKQLVEVTAPTNCQLLSDNNLAQKPSCLLNGGGCRRIAHAIIDVVT